MLLPIITVDVGIGDGIAAVDHLPVAHIDTNMGHAVGVRRVIGVPEENEITGLGVRHGYRGADVIEALRPQPPYIPSAVIDNPAHKARAIKGCAGTAAAPNIGLLRVFI